MLGRMIAEEQEENVLDLRIAKAPYCAKNNEVFGINELDEAYDYVKDSSEWYVDIYDNVWIGKFGHANYIGRTLWSGDLEAELVKHTGKRTLTAREKFDARLKELGIYDDWCEQGCVGRVGASTDKGISILVHEDEDDRYTEFTYPAISEMQEHDSFRIKALSEFHVNFDFDEEFARKLIRWVANPKNECPLNPVDVYFLWSDYTWQDFEDDKEPEPADERIEEYCPHCDQEVLLEPELKVHKCPNCGKWIVSCTQCPLENCTKPCPLEEMGKILNRA